MSHRENKRWKATNSELHEAMGQLPYLTEHGTYAVSMTLKLVLVMAGAGWLWWWVTGT
jgi:hypothetical protein